VKLIISDDHAGLRKARQALFTGVLWQRCQFCQERIKMSTNHRNKKSTFQR
jgi:transposase-like protein